MLILFSSMVQWLNCRTMNSKVTGSIPRSANNFFSVRIHNSAMIPRFGLFKALNIFSNKDQMRQFSLQIKTTELHNFILKSNFNLTYIVASPRKQKKLPFYCSHPDPFRLSQWSQKICCLVLARAVNSAGLVAFSSFDSSLRIVS